MHSVFLKKVESAKKNWMKIGALINSIFLFPEIPEFILTFFDTWTLPTEQASNFFQNPPNLKINIVYIIHSQCLLFHLCQLYCIILNSISSLTILFLLSLSMLINRIQHTDNNGEVSCKKDSFDEFMSNGSKKVKRREVI